MGPVVVRVGNGNRSSRRGRGRHDSGGFALALAQAQALDGKGRSRPSCSGGRWSWVRRRPGGWVGGWVRPVLAADLVLVWQFSRLKGRRGPNSSSSSSSSSRAWSGKLGSLILIRAVWAAVVVVEPRCCDFCYWTNCVRALRLHWTAGAAAGGSSDLAPARAPTARRPL
ncbi:hypothetical protein BD289DRAFT_87428 [Coniella lustricola]|uniref:Uncharacterized protein n=1 Tax=Coniella lustricola TaxID=2025994 RepID=A0A2T2ZYR2_9PEZI|nr:hypothetical protein BD289DRAFT_87428 [Coniella lustricola]